MGVIGLQSRCQKCCVPSGSSGGGCVPCIFQFLETAHIPWLVDPSSNGITLTSAFIITSPLILTLLPLSLLRMLVITLNPPG